MHRPIGLILLCSIWASSSEDCKSFPSCQEKIETLQDMLASVLTGIASPSGINTTKYNASEEETGFNDAATVCKKANDMRMMLNAAKTCYAKVNQSAPVNCTDFDSAGQTLDAASESLDELSDACEPDCQEKYKKFRNCYNLPLGECKEVEKLEECLNVVTAGNCTVAKSFSDQQFKKEADRCQISSGERVQISSILLLVALLVYRV